MTLDGFLTTTELSKRWGKVRGTLVNWRVQKKGPKFKRVMGIVLYPVSEVEKYERAASRARVTLDSARRKTL